MIFFKSKMFQAQVQKNYKCGKNYKLVLSFIKAHIKEFKSIFFPCFCGILGKMNVREDFKQNTYFFQGLIVGC